MHHALQQRPERNRPKLRRGQLGELAIRLHKAMQRVGAALDHAQAAAEVAQRCFVAGQGIHPLQQAAGNGFDGRQRVRKLVAENPDQPLPRHLFFFLEWEANIG